MSFILFNLLLILIIIFLLVVLSWVWPPNSPWAPWWRTNRKTARTICELAKIKPSDLIYELGSGNATFLITAAKEYGARGIGIELDPLRFFVSTLMIHIIRVNERIIIKRKNFFDEDLSEATMVYVYLVPKTLEKLLPKFRKELKKGTRIISYKYQLNLKSLHSAGSGQEISNLKNNLFLYKI